MADSTTQEFSGRVISVGEEDVVVKVTGTIYPAVCTGINEGTDTPIFTVTEDDKGEISGATFVSCPPGQREEHPDGSWFWMRPPW